MTDTIRSRLRPKRPSARSTFMATTCTHQNFTVPRLPGRSVLASAHGLGTAIAKRVGAFLARLTPTLPAERAYGQLLQASGGKFTDALEREADRRLRGGWDNFS